MKLDADQQHYMKSVLGLDRVLVPEIGSAAEAVGADPLARRADETAPQPVSALASRLIVLLPLAPEEFPLRGEPQVLIDKMIRAMKLDPGDVTLVSWNENAPGVDVRAIPLQAGERPVLIFAHGAAAEFTGFAPDAGQWFDWQGARAMATFSPRELLALPDRKKQTWAHLQAIMKEL